VTGPSPADQPEYDELAEAAAREHAGRLAAQRALRAWLMSATASACVILLGVTAVSLIGGTRHPSGSSDRRIPAPFPSVLHIDQLSQQDLSGVLVLATIALPAGWSSATVASMDFGSGTGPVHWSTTWTARNEATDGPRAIAAALTSQGWQRCAGGGAHTECWQLDTHQLILTWGPGEGCPSHGPCWVASVVLVTSPPQPSAVASAPS
jgi:hypothetical protein